MSFRLRRTLIVTALAVSTGAGVEAKPEAGLWERFDHIPYSGARGPVESLEVRVDSWETGAAFPVVFGDGTTAVRNRIEHRHTNMQYRNRVSSKSVGRDIDHLDLIEYKVYIAQRMSENWRAVVYLAPGFSGDFDSFDPGDSFVLAVAAGALRDFGDRFMLGGGIAYSRDFGRPLIVPVVHFKWRNGGSWSAKGTLPRNVIVTWRASDLVGVGVSGLVEGDRYCLNPADFGVDNPQMGYSVVTAGPAVYLHFSKWLHLILEAGTTVARKWEFRNGAAKIREPDIERSLYGRVRVEVGIYSKR